MESAEEGTRVLRGGKDDGSDGEMNRLAYVIGRYLRPSRTSEDVIVERDNETHASEQGRHVRPAYAPPSPSSLLLHDDRA